MNAADQLLRSATRPRACRRRDPSSHRSSRRREQVVGLDGRGWDGGPHAARAGPGRPRAARPFRPAPRMGNNREGRLSRSGRTLVTGMHLVGCCGRIRGARKSARPGLARPVRVVERSPVPRRPSGRPRRVLATTPALGDEPRALEDGDVLLHGREGIGYASARRNGHTAITPPQDVAPRRVGERVEDVVGPAPRFYNHLVVDYQLENARAARCASRDKRHQFFGATPRTRRMQGRRVATVVANWPAKRPLAPLNNESPALAGPSYNAPDRIRTCDLRFRRPTLYPAELQAPGVQG